MVPEAVAQPGAFLAGADLLVVLPLIGYRPWLVGPIDTHNLRSITESNASTMKILYGIMGTGEGHLTRARALAPELWKRGVQVDFVVSGRPKGQRYFDMDFFGPNIAYLDGFCLAIKNGQLDWLASCNQMKHDFPAFKQAVASTRTRIEEQDYDLILTDFEPVTAWAGNLAGRPVMGICRQFAALNPKLPMSNALISFVYQAIVPAKVSLGFFFHPFESKTILPPMAPPPREPIETNMKNPYPPNTCLVYLPFEALEQIEAMLLSIQSWHFVIYHKDVSAPRLRSNGSGSLEYRPLSRTSFKETLFWCQGVICNAGFGLLSESLQLGKELLVKPVAGQTEQESNAKATQILGFGTVLHSLDTTSVLQWLQQLELPVSSNRAPLVLPNVAGALADWIAEGQWDQPQNLTSQIWDEVEENNKSLAVASSCQSNLSRLAWCWGNIIHLLLSSIAPHTRVYSVFPTFLAIASFWGLLLERLERGYLGAGIFNSKLGKQCGSQGDLVQTEGSVHLNIIV